MDASVGGAARGERRRSGGRAEHPHLLRAAAQPRGGGANAPPASAGTSTKAGTDARPLPLAGKTLVLTGTLPTLSRDEAKELIEAAGGKVMVRYRRRRTTWSPAKEAGSKLDKARELGVPVLDEAALRALLKAARRERRARLAGRTAPARRVAAARATRAAALQPGRGRLHRAGDRRTHGGRRRAAAPRARCLAGELARRRALAELTPLLRDQGSRAAGATSCCRSSTPKARCTAPSNAAMQPAGPDHAGGASGRPPSRRALLGAAARATTRPPIRACGTRWSAA